MNSIILATTLFYFAANPLTGVLPEFVGPLNKNDCLTMKRIAESADETRGYHYRPRYECLRIQVDEKESKR